MDDCISVSLVRKLAKCSSPDAPVHFLLDFAECNSPPAMEYVGEVLQTNSTISWLEVEFQYQHISVDCMANLFQFVSHHSALRVLEVRMGSAATRTPASLMGYIDEVMRLFLLAAAQNGNIETVLLSGRPCMYVPEIFKFLGKTCSSLRELELVDFPDSVVGAWPPNSSISRLRLKPAKMERYRNPFNPDGHPGLTGILDLLADSSSRGYSIEHLHIENWSWSLSKYLQSPNSAVKSLHLAKVDFRHDPFLYGFSCADVFCLGLQGSKATTELCLDECFLDNKAATKILSELKNDTLGIKRLKLKDINLDSKQIKQLFECECLEGLEFDGPLDIIDKCVTEVNEALGNCTLSSLKALKIPVTSLSVLGPSLQTLVTTHSLSRLEITNTTLKKEDIDCLTGWLKDERCQLNHVGIQYLFGFDPRIILALEGEASKVESFRLEDVIGESLTTVVDTLVGSLAEIKTLKNLTIVCPDLKPKMEEELGEALPGNWSLENFNFERLPAPEGSTEKIHKVEPVITRTFARKVEEVVDRNRAKKRSILSTASPNSVMNGPGTYNPASMQDLEIS